VGEILISADLCKIPEEMYKPGGDVLIGKDEDKDEDKRELKRKSMAKSIISFT